MIINIPVSGASQSNEIYSLRVNGQVHEVKDAWIGESLLYVLRERLGLPGAKGACEQGECGSCTVIVDKQAVCSCLVMAAAAVDTEILTVEGLGPDGSLTDVQSAFLAEGGVQCGFCTPGFIVAVHHLLENNLNPSDDEIRESLSGNICRCTGYGRILEAVRTVADQRRNPS
jgi:carbon-monoxide dehydrogenase small subunit